MRMLPSVTSRSSSNLRPNSARLKRSASRLTRTVPRSRGLPQGSPVSFSKSTPRRYANVQPQPIYTPGYVLALFNSHPAAKIHEHQFRRFCTILLEGKQTNKQTKPGVTTSPGDIITSRAKTKNAKSINSFRLEFKNHHGPLSLNTFFMVDFKTSDAKSFFPFYFMVILGRVQFK